MKTIAEFDKCPDCGASARLMGPIIQEEVAKGNMSSDLAGYTQVSVYCNVDQRRPPIVGGRIPGARVFKDVCVNCGREYTVRIETGHVTLPTRRDMPPTFS